MWRTWQKEHHCHCGTPGHFWMLDWGRTPPGVQSASWSGVLYGTPYAGVTKWQMDCSTCTPTPRFTLQSSSIFIVVKWQFFSSFSVFPQKRNKIWNGELSVRWIEVQKWSAGWSAAIHIPKKMIGFQMDCTPKLFLDCGLHSKISECSNTLQKAFMYE